ncbi:MAG: 3-coathanger stack domain-containing protein [Bacteroidota bacterium]
MSIKNIFSHHFRGKHRHSSGTIQQYLQKDALAIFLQQKQKNLFNKVQRYVDQFTIPIIGILLVIQPLVSVAQNTVGEEFRVNANTISSQTNPDVAMSKNGRSVIVGSTGDNANLDIYFSLYDESGSIILEDALTNTFTIDRQIQPSTAMDKEGNFVVVWASGVSSGTGQDGSNFGIYGQRFNKEGNTIGTEFQINTYTNNSQLNPAVAMDEEGNFVVVWSSFGQDGSDYGIYGQRYDNSGSKIGGEFQINTFTVGTQSSPCVAMNKDGSFVVSWTSFGQDGDLGGIYGQLYNPIGNKVGGEFLVNTYVTSGQTESSVAMNKDGNFVITWVSFEQDGSSSGIYSQRYDNTGNKIGIEFRVNTTTASVQTNPDIAMNSLGNFIITWTSFALDGSNLNIYGQSFYTDGSTCGSEFLVNTYVNDNQEFSVVAMDADCDFIIVWGSEDFQNDGMEDGIYAQRYFKGTTEELTVNPPSTLQQENPDIAIDDNGNFVVVWDSPDGDQDGIYGQRYSANGSKIGSDFLVNTYTTSFQRFPAVAMDVNGNFVVVWDSNGQDGDALGIFGQRYDANGSKIGAEFQVNTYTIGNQDDPSIDMNASGEFVVTWQSSGQDGDGRGVFGQRFDATGNKIGAEFQVNTYTIDTQFRPAVAMDEDGAFVVTWESNGQDGDLGGIYGQRFDANGNKAGVEFQVNTYTTGIQWKPAIGMNSNGRFVIVWRSDGQDGSNDGVYGQRYDSNGNEVGTEFQINTYADSNQWADDIAMDNKGNFIATWASFGQDGSSYGVYGQRFNSDGSKIGGEFLVNIYTDLYQGDSRVAMNADGDFVIAWETDKGNGFLTNLDVVARVYQGKFSDCEITNTCPCNHPDYTILEDFYSATNGSSWTTNTDWLSDCDPCGELDGTPWHGITCDINNQVTQLILQNNNLTGSLPSNIGDLSSLQTLDLRENSLQGALPISLGNLAYLKYLLLQNNGGFTGNIPTQLGDLSNLKSLRLEVSQLTGGIPASLGNLDSLEYLGLSDNFNLGGTIPTTLGNLSNLQYLYLKNCGLTGSIPTELGDLDAILLMWLYANNLSGNIPTSLGNLTTLENLRLHLNNLDGNLPESLGDLVNLTFLELRDNNLSGCYPAEISNFCTQLGIESTNANISDGNSFDANWEDFCLLGVGECDASCPQTLTLTMNPTQDSTYRAQDSIVSTVQMVSSPFLDITYKAGEVILLKIGFEVKNGNTFQAIIEDCPQNLNEVVEKREQAIGMIKNTIKTYPNPFSIATTIEYELSESSEVEIHILDKTGRFVETLLSNQWQEQGNYRLEWLPKNRQAGIYFLRTRIGEGWKTEKLILIE